MKDLVHAARSENNTKTHGEKISKAITPRLQYAPTHITCHIIIDSVSFLLKERGSGHGPVQPVYHTMKNASSAIGIRLITSIRETNITMSDR